MQLIINILITSSTYYLLAYSFLIIYKSVNFFHLSHAISITLSGYCSFLLSSQLHIPFWLSIVIAILILIILNLALLNFIYLPLIRKKIENWQLLIASLGIYIILQNLISIFFGNSVIELRSWQVVEGINIFGAKISVLQVITITTSLLIVWFYSLYLKKSKIGKSILAISSNPNLSIFLGISYFRTIQFSFIIGSSLAAVGGILISLENDLTPTFGFDWLIYSVIVIIISGLGKLRHLLLSAFLIAFLQHMSSYYISNEWKEIITYSILIVFLYFKPIGFSGQKLKKQEV